MRVLPSANVTSVVPDSKICLFWYIASDSNCTSFSMPLIVKVPSIDTGTTVTSFHSAGNSEKEFVAKVASGYSVNV